MPVVHPGDNTLQVLECEPVNSARNVDWRSAIDALGTDLFSNKAMQALDQSAGVEHFSAFRLDGSGVHLVVAGSIFNEGTAQTMGAIYAQPEYCRRDPTIQMVMRGRDGDNPILLRIDPAAIGDEILREQIYLSQGVCDRVFASGSRDGRVYGLSVLRTRDRGNFSSENIDSIRSIADTWLSLIAKHENLAGLNRGADPGAMMLGPVSGIEARLNGLMPSLTPRETQVCARILRGMSTPGIAVDLGVREDSVATYRKRAYRRLAIGTRFELIQRFIGDPGRGTHCRQH
jgi:DNA-binding CsgD family transcriptional regulator